MTSSGTGSRTPQGPGSLSGAPRLPEGLTDVFTSRYVQAGEVRLHAVTGGSGPPLLLLAGWPQTWYAWRLLMPALAGDHQVVAVDPRGVGLSDKPQDGYDTGTLAADAAALMSALGHERFAVVGHDIGMWTGYALAADHPERVERLVVAEAVIPGLSPSPPLFGSQEAAERLWHFGFNRLSELNEQLVRGREHLFFGNQFAVKAASPTAIPEHAVEVYVNAIAAGPGALRSSFAPYRALDTTIEQNRRHKEHRLQLPVLTIAGAQGSGELVGQTMALAAADVQSLVLPDCGHYPAEEAPEAVLAALSTFLAPSRDTGTARPERPSEPQPAVEPGEDSCAPVVWASPRRQPSSPSPPPAQPPLPGPPAGPSTLASTRRPPSGTRPAPHSAAG